MKIKYELHRVLDSARIWYTKNESWEFCCEEFKNQRDFLKLGIDGIFSEKPEVHLETDRICEREGNYQCADFENIRFCPYCGEKVILEELARMQFIAKYKKVMREYTEMELEEIKPKERAPHEA